MSDFWDTATGWDDYNPEAPAAGQYESSPDLGVPPVAPQITLDAELMTYAPLVGSLYKAASSVGSESYFKELLADPKSGVSVKAEDAGGDGWMQKLAKSMGFTNTNDFAKVMAPAAVTLAGAAISGAAGGYAASQKHEIEKQLAESRVATDAASAGLARSKTNQAGLASLKYTPGSGLINAPWKAAPIVPPNQRVPA